MSLKGYVRNLIQVLSWQLPVGTEENHKPLSQYRQCPGRDSSLGPPEYEAGVDLTVYICIICITFSSRLIGRKQVGTLLTCI
jgi:hypothetical protein